MHIDLKPAEVTFLRDHLVRHLKSLEDELVHTERRELKKAIADETRQLRALIDRFPS